MPRYQIIDLRNATNDTPLWATDDRIAALAFQAELGVMYGVYDAVADEAIG